MKKNFASKVIYMLVVACIVFTTTFNSISWARAASSSTLGTSEALGSPVLNDKFSSESWDKWELIVFGIYLSNFCVPLVDSYESAFSTSSTYGSKGAGLSALEIGSGNGDSTNSIIQQLTTQAINFQVQTATQQLYVAYTPLTDGVLGETPDPNSDGTTIRAARFSDLFLLTDDPGDENGEQKSWGKTDSLVAKACGSSNGYQLNEIDKANLPTFYIKVGDTYIKVFDFTNSWDFQIATAMINKGVSSSCSDEFISNYRTLYGENENGNDASQIGFDSFGNIVGTVDGHNTVVIPAAANQHLTKTDNINLLNSWVVNGCTQDINNNIVSLGRQSLTWQENLFADWSDGWDVIGTTINGVSYESGGTPAFGYSKTPGKLKDGIVVIYRDSDSVYYEHSTDGISIGDVMLEMMSKGSKADLPLKIELVSSDALKGKVDPVGNNALFNSLAVCSAITNQLNNDQAIGMDSILLPSGTEEPLFEDTVLVANQSTTSSDTKSDRDITRQLTNFMYTVYKSGSIETKIGTLSKDSIVAMLQGIDSEADMQNAYESVWEYYKAYASGMSGADYNTSGSWFNPADNAYIGNRFTVVQIPSQNLSQCANMLNCTEGDFALYAGYIYITYLRFYGINSSSVLGEAGGNTTTLNEQLFNASAAKDFSIDDIDGVVSKEQKQEEVLNLSYLMLSDSSAGKEYRNKISKSNLASFINNQYEAIVYGARSDNSAATAGKAGFLHVASLEENPFTSSIIDKYSKIAIIVLTVVLIAIILAGLLSNKKITWYFITIIIYVNIVVALPSLGNISSNVVSSAVQKMFSSKNTFWSISEQIADAEALSSYDATDEDQSVLAELLDGLQMVSGDRTLMIKKDISSKVTTKLSSDYKSKIQLKSVRWLIPLLMQQVESSDEEDVNNYVYVNMLNMMDDASNVYVYYNKNYAESIGTIAAKNSDGSNTGDSIPAASRVSSYYTDYEDTSSDTSYNGVNYRHIGYYESVYATMPHTYFYLLEATGHTGTPLCISSNGLVDNTDIESYSNYIDSASTSNITAWKSTAEHIMDVSDEYERNDLTTVDKSYGYLLNSETVYNYMYEAVEDSFASSETLGSLIGKIQGQYREDTNGEKKRDNFMYATSTESGYTGDVRDILDLQEFFTNNLPYMYKMWLSAGGFDGKSGVLADDEIEGHNYYDGSKQSWLFRCNWAIKLFENEDLNSGATVRDKDGNKYTVDNMLIPSCYPSSRPMIFSRAQQNAYGLSDSDLSYVELKCVKVNEDTALDWTSLLNYAGTSNLTKEILLRQMAMDATTKFNSEFTTGMTERSKYGLVPVSLDLRSLSFDSIMKMIILNVTKDSSYVYGSTIETLIERTDIVTSALLLATAMICTYIIPFVRNIMAVLVLALSVYAAVRSLASDNRFKAKILLGALITQVEIIIVNLAYYGVFSMFITLTGSDEVISVSSINASVSSGNPVWALLLILIISIAYVVALVKMMQNFIENRDDLGFDRYSALIGTIGGKVSSGIQNTVGNVGSAIGAGQRSSTSKTIEAINNKRKHKSSTSDKQSSISKDEGKSVTESKKDRTDTDSSSKKDDVVTIKYDDSVDNNVTREKTRIDNEIAKGGKTSNTAKVDNESGSGKSKKA